MIKTKMPLTFSFVFFYNYGPVFYSTFYITMNFLYVSCILIWSCLVIVPTFFIKLIHKVSFAN